MPKKFSYPMTFLPCRDLTITRNFYEKILKLPVALEQSKCIVFKVGIGNHFSYWGFCSHYNEYLDPPHRVFLSLVVEDAGAVDEWHRELVDQQVDCIRTPQYTAEFKIYHAFYKDPMGYTVEIQAFDEDGRPEGV